MKRALVIVLCSTIVAAFEGRLAAAAAVSEDVPVPGGRAAVAEALGFVTVPDRGRFVGELTRLLEGADFPARRRPTVSAMLAPLAQKPAAELVPVPLTQAVWADAIFHRRINRNDLLFAILGDRQAALVCHALSGEDDETLAYFTAHPAVLTTLYQQSSAAFGAFGGSLHVRGDRVVPPGGDEAVPLWEAVVGQQVSRPDLFIETLFALGEGRIAYLYDTVAILDPDRGRFALGLWMPDPAMRLERMAALAMAWSASFNDWRVNITPFRREVNDAASAFWRVRVDPGGAPAFPRSRDFWFQAYANGVQPEEAAGELQANSGDRPIDAAWVVGAIVVSDVRRRADRLDQLSFGQRVFAALPAADVSDALTALRALPRCRMLMWTLERMGIGKAGIYASAATSSERLSSLDRVRGFVALAQFQGALALLQRMTAVGTFDRAASERLVASLIAVPLNEEGRYGGAIARWLDAELRPAIAPAGTFEASLLAALSGRSTANTPNERRIAWEGRLYRYDPAGAERQRLQRVREKQNSLSIDAALGLEQAVGLLGAASVRPEDAVAARARVQTVLDEAPRTAKVTDRDALPPGVASRPDVRDATGKWADALDRIVAGKDLTAIGRVRAGFADVTDEAAAQALVSLAYALEIGDPEGATLLAGDLSRRHDFGFALANAERRLRGPWTLPWPDSTPGLAWHVDGSLLGLDVGLARLGLRRLGTATMPDAPTLPFNERDTFTVSAALVNAFALTDAGRDAIANALDAGRRRVKTLIDNPDGVDAIGDTISLDGWRRRAARWTVVHAPDDLESLFSLTELATLGNLRTADMKAWGMSAITTTGCLCTEAAPPGRWRALTGRPQLGIVAAAVADLNLHVAGMLRARLLPAGLAKYVLSAAVQDFVDEVRPIDEDDWLTLVRGGQATTRDRFEDYVAAAVADGPLLRVDP